MQPDDLRPEDQYGWAVAVSGETVAVSAPGRDDDYPTIPALMAADKGLVAVYRRSATDWVTEARFNGASYAYRCVEAWGCFSFARHFGFSLALEGDDLVVGMASLAWDGHDWPHRREGVTWSRWPPAAASVDGPGDLARFAGATAIARDLDGTLLVLDPGRGTGAFGGPVARTIRRVTLAGHVTTLFEVVVSRPEQEWATVGMAVDTAGSIWTAERIWERNLVSPKREFPSELRRYSRDGSQVLVARADPYFVDIAAAPSGGVFAIEGCAVVHISAAGEVRTLVGNRTDCRLVDGDTAGGRLSRPSSLTVTPDGTLYLVDESVLRRVRPSGGRIETVTSLDPLDGRIAAADDGSVWVASWVGWPFNKVRRVEGGTVGPPLAGRAVRCGRSIDGTGEAACLADVDDVTTTADGRLALVEGNRVRVVTTAGEVRTLAGQAGVHEAADTLHGYAVALRPGRAVSTAPRSPLSLSPLELTGAATVTDFGAAGSATSVLTVGNPEALSRYGAAVAILEDGTVALGPANGCLWMEPDTCTDDTIGLPEASHLQPIRLFRQLSDGRWVQRGALPTPTLAPRSGYGTALAAQGTLLVAGAPEWDYRPQEPAPHGDIVGPGRVFVYDLATLDSDGDTLPDDWETSFGLDPTAALSDDGAGGDPDHDGRTNAEEFAAHTHPTTGLFTAQLFAEGATSDFFDTEFSIANPGDAEAIVNLRFMKTGGALASTAVRVPARQSRKIRVGSVAGMTTAEFSTQVESDQPVVVDRLMWWDRATAYGSHGERRAADEVPVTSPQVRPTWYLAEGATHSGFELFYLLQNPSGSASTVKITYLRPDAPPLEKTYVVPGLSRATVWVNQEEFPAGSGNRALANAEVAAVVETPWLGPDGLPLPVWAPVIVERAMYRTRPGTNPAQPGVLFEAGHASAGIPNPSTAWFFAEGATGDFFDEFLLLANVEATPVTVTATYLLESGQTFTKSYTVAPKSRFTIWVDEEEIPARSGVRPLADVRAVSATLTGSQPFLAERAMWWPGPTFATWTEAHNSAGATTAAPRWAAAAGAARDTPVTDTYYLIANTATAATDVRLTLLFDDGTPAVTKTVTVAPSSRVTVDVRGQFPEAVGKGFGAVFESLGTLPIPIVVEWAIYSDALGQRWAAGANALATVVK
jgi:hypothetical protein